MRDSFQSRVTKWGAACFGPRIAFDLKERNYRFLEEALELVQCLDLPKEKALELVEYVYGRPKGEIPQEIGGVIITLVLLAAANGFDVDKAGETELERCWEKIDVIREKQKRKPIRSNV